MIFEPDRWDAELDHQDLVNELLHAMMAVSHALDRLHALARDSTMRGDATATGKIQDAIAALATARDRLLQDVERIAEEPDPP
jgi:hypothetical protein